MRIGKCRVWATLIAPLALGSCTSEAPPNVESIQSTAQASTKTSWAPTKVMLAKRKAHAALKLADSRVLVVGGTADPKKTAELYDATKEEWTPLDVPDNVVIPAATDCRPALTQLDNGTVLVVSGETVWSVDLTKNEWVAMALPMMISTCKPKVTALPGNRALILADVGLGMAFIHDGSTIEATNTPLPPPTKGSWIDAAVITLDGDTDRVLISGGSENNAGTVLYDPSNDTWVTAGDMFYGRSNHAIASLSRASVLVAGGDVEGPFSGQWSDTAEIFNVKTLQWVPTTHMLSYRENGPNAVRLASGLVLVVGGSLSSTAELYDPSTSQWSLIESDDDIRFYGHNSTVLDTGRVLVTGGELPAESDAAALCDALAFVWEPRAALPAENRAAHSATRLDDGRLLVVGGKNSADEIVLQDAWIYDPLQDGISDSPWSTTESPLSQHAMHTATKLADGRVLVVGGFEGAAPELFDPAATSTMWTATNSSAEPKSVLGSTATLLNDGRVLVVGGFSENDGTLVPVTSVYLYEPATNSWTVGASLPNGIAGGVGHSATLLTDGSVLVIGGFDACPAQDTPVTARKIASRFFPKTNTWEEAGPINQFRAFHSATRLDDGRVVIAGGGKTISGPCASPIWADVHTSSEIYSPDYSDVYTSQNDKSFSAGNMTEARTEHQAISLGNGRILLAGGRQHSLGNTLSSAEVFDPSDSTWTLTSRMQYARSGHTLTSFVSGVYALGGYQPYAPYSGAASMELFPQAKNGSPCTLDDQCISNICSDSVCCDEICDSPCQACSKAAAIKRDKGDNKNEENDGICEDISGCQLYACSLETGSCGSTCTDIGGCASGKVCNPLGECVDPLGNASMLDETGCAAAPTESNASPWATLALVACLYTWRRKNAQRKS